MASGKYIPCTGQLATLKRREVDPVPGPSSSLPSRPKFSAEWSFVPKPRMRTNVALAMSSSAIALFSCKVTHAVFESSDTVMYSGSRSCATLAFGPKIRMLESRDVPLKAVNRTVVTSACDSVVMTSGSRMMLTLPSGSFPAVTYVLGSPSLATSTARPSGVNVSMSGSAPTVTTASSSPLVLKNATLPLAVFGLASTATATTPFRTETLFTIAP